MHRVCVSCSRILLLMGGATVLLGAPQTLQSGPSDPASPHRPQSEGSCVLFLFLVRESSSFWLWKSQRTREHHTMEGASRIKAADSYSNPFSLHIRPVVYDR